MASPPERVRIPPDWLHEPTFATRSDLLGARRHDRKQLALASTPAKSTPPSSFSVDKRFARSDTIFRDSFRKSGAFSRVTAPRDETEFHPRATCSGLVTRTAFLQKRADDRHDENVRLEPPEVMRLRDIPKTPQLKEWWKQSRGESVYVDDPSAICAASLRLALAKKHGDNLEIGPMDPGKIRCPASVDERRRIHEQKAQLTNKINHITHSIPDDYLTLDRTETAVITRASDLYAQEKRDSDGSGSNSGGGGTGGGEAGTPGVTRYRSDASLSSSSAFPLVSPIKIANPRRRTNRLEVENLVLESTSQRELLDQLKTWQPPPDMTASKSPLSLSHDGAWSPVGSGSTHELSRLGAASPTKCYTSNQSGGLESPIRCGGFT